MSENEKKKQGRPIHIEEAWEYDIMTRSLFYIPDQWIDEDKQFERPNTGDGTLQVSIKIPYMAYESLVEFIAKKEKGVLRTDREEDLKLIHRLLDILTKAVDAKKI